MFGSKQKSGLTLFEEQSKEALDIFSKTCDSLASANALGKGEIAERDAIIEQAQKEKAQIELSMSRNERVITKINQFFTDEN